MKGRSLIRSLPALPIGTQFIKQRTKRLSVQGVFVFASPAVFVFSVAFLPALPDVFSDVLLSEAAAFPLSFSGEAPNAVSGLPDF